jgi:ribosomal-protein-alanine N-acetyltransferase
MLYFKLNPKIACWSLYKRSFATGNKVSEAPLRVVNIKNLSSQLRDQIYEIEEECFLHPYPREFIDSLQDLFPETFLVAVRGDLVLGYAATSVSRHIAHLLSIAVRKSLRRKGVGSTLIYETIRLLKAMGISLIKLEVRKGNRDAIQFYERLGFKKIGFIPSYYEGGEEAVEYWMELR